MTRFSTFFPRISETFSVVLGLFRTYQELIEVSLRFIGIILWIFIFSSRFITIVRREIYFIQDCWFVDRWFFILFYIYQSFKDKLYQVIFVRNIFSTMTINTIACDLAPRVPWASAKILPFSEGVVQKRLCRATCRLDNWPERVRIDVTGVDNRHGTGF